MTHLSQSAFAARLGVRRSYITRLKQEGRLVMSADGQWVDVEASQARIAETADPGKVAVAERHAAARGAAVELSPAAVNVPETAKTAPSPADDSDPEPQTPDYQKAKARKADADASMAEMELAERAGQLFRAAEVLEVIADAATTFRVSLDARRAMLVSQLAVMSDERAVREFLEDQDEALLADLSARFSDIGKHK